MTDVFALLAAYQLKHFLADYPLQTPYMLGKFKSGWDFLGPLAAHAWVHALFTLVIAGCYGLAVGHPNPHWLALPLAAFDFAAHFAMDRIKAGPRYLGRFKDMKAPAFWWCLGLDQMVHHFTHYAIIYALVTR